MERYAAAAVCNDGTDEKETVRNHFDQIEEWNKNQESEGTASTLVIGTLPAHRPLPRSIRLKLQKSWKLPGICILAAIENTDEARKLDPEYDIVPEAVAKKALPRCNIVCITMGRDEREARYLGTQRLNLEAVGEHLRR